MPSPLIGYAPDVETAALDEERLTAEILEQMARAQTRNSDRRRHAVRDAHAKSHAILKATLTVHDGLAPELAQGAFAQPRTYEALVRLSSAPGNLHSDQIPAPRGFATKLIGVDGERLADDSGHNQDFLMVNFPVLAFGTIGKYKQLLALLEKNAEAPEFLQRVMAGTARLAEEVVEAVGGTPSATLVGLARDNAHVLGETYHTQAAIRYGDFIAKLSFAPKSESVNRLTGVAMNVDGFSSIRDAVSDFFSTQTAEYELRAQLCTDREAMPVEDAAVLWSEEASPQRAIASLRIEPQDPYSPARRVYGDDVLAFNPWNGVAAHQPLGSIMRIRKPAYQRSSQFRHHYNHTERLEPASLADIPD